MEKVTLKATRRNVIGKQVGQLRRAGELPAVIYGHDIEPTSISLNFKEATTVLSHLSASSLVMLDLEGKEYPTLVRERQREPIRGVYLHLDFQAVDLAQKIRANVAIVLTGISGAVKDFSAILVTTLNALEVEALPQDLPERIVVDIAKLEKIGDGIHVRDLVLPANVQIVSSTDEMIVLAAAPKEEVVEVAATEVEAAVTDGTEPEVVDKGKKEEEGAETGKEKK